MPGRKQVSAQYRHEERAEQHRTADREGLRQRQRLEETPGLIGQREDGQEADHRRRRRREQRSRHLPRGGDHR